jgi:hypothetical protein
MRQRDGFVLLPFGLFCGKIKTKRADMVVLLKIQEPI